MSSVAKEDISSVATEEIFSVATEEPEGEMVIIVEAGGSLLGQ